MRVSPSLETLSVVPFASGTFPDTASKRRSSASSRLPAHDDQSATPAPAAINGARSGAANPTATAPAPCRAAMTSGIVTRMFPPLSSLLVSVIVSRPASLVPRVFSMVRPK
ncbi:MAG: hypothetical protein FJX76_25120 [Armatimonadetes bacterium]|nr:hypothetical protein [Armatimonadota bacterium]